MLIRSSHIRCIAAILLLAFPVTSDVRGAVQILTYSSGTGFFVTRDGYVVTNNHVVEHCMDINVSGSVPQSPAKLIAQDTAFDLALLRTDALPVDQARLSTTKQPLRAGDPVVVVGYPGQAWQTGQTKTREATILSTKGPRGEEKWLEFSDALAQGNSGGPLLDGAGNVVGVVAAKAELVTVNTANGQEEGRDRFDIAISLPVLRQFLESNDVRYLENDSGILESAGHITDDARRFVVNVRCRLQ